MADELQERVIELVEKGLDGRLKSRKTEGAWVLTLLGLIITALVSMDVYFVRSWMDRVEAHTLESQKQMQTIVQDIKAIELKLTALSSTLIDRVEIRRMIYEHATPLVREAIHSHEKEFHSK